MKFLQIASLVAVASAHRLNSNSKVATLNTEQVQILSELVEAMEHHQTDSEKANFDFGSLLSKGKDLLGGLFH